MIWQFISTRTFTLKTRANAPPKDILKVLHDPASLFTSSPLAEGFTRDPLNPHAYTITERLTFLGMFTTRTSFTCLLNLREDGLDAAVATSLGTKLLVQYRVIAGGNGTTELADTTTVHGITFLMPYIMSTASRAHKSALENLASRADNRTSRRLDPGHHLGSAPLLGVIQGPLIASLIVCCAITALFRGVTNSFVANTGVVLTGIAVLSLSKRMKDPYGLFHLAFNKLPGDDGGASPKTEWLNMGFWRSTDIFPQACKALAMKLIRAVECKRGGAMLDVGHGTGESLLLLLSDPSIPRPSTLTGITSLPTHHFRSQERVNRLLASLKDPRPEVSFYLGDAVYRPNTFAHPLDPSSDVMFDSILALDCAYHFDTRNIFLRQSLRKLAPGGRIALADICFDPDIFQSRKMWLLSSLFTLVLKQNMVSAEAYVAQMKDMGYVDVKLEDITTDVFPGFIRFLKSRGIGWRAFALVLGWYAKAGARFVIVSGSNVL